MSTTTARRNYFVDTKYTDDTGKTRTEHNYRVRATSADHAKSEACRLGGYSPDEITRVSTTQSTAHLPAWAR